MVTTAKTSLQRREVEQVQVGIAVRVADRTSRQCRVARVITIAEERCRVVNRVARREERHRSGVDRRRLPPHVVSVSSVADAPRRDRSVHPLVRVRDVIRWGAGDWECGRRRVRDEQCPKMGSAAFRAEFKPRALLLGIKDVYAELVGRADAIASRKTDDANTAGALVKIVTRRAVGSERRPSG